jgi:hypothetical protein
MFARLALAVLLAAGAFPAFAADGEAARPAGIEQRRWSAHMDNDLFAFVEKDRDYTAGFAFSLAGDGARTHPLSLGNALEWADGATRFARLASRGEEEGHALDVGLLLFTPQDLGSREPLRDDRPYASLAYLSTSSLAHDASRQAVYQSTLTLGVLGLPIAEGLHRSVHKAFGSEEPRGYDHQISAGGEPTFRYTVGRQQLLASGSYEERPFTLRFGVGASVGYVSEATAEIGLRLGRTARPWWASLPATSEYAGHAPVGARRSPANGAREVLFDVGVKVRARVYNSFLQGQFRDSAVEYSSSEVEHLLWEAWFGVTTVLKNRVSISYTIRRQTEELDVGRGARDFTWASIGVAQEF